MSVMIKCSKEAFEKCPYHNICGDAENAFFMNGSDCDKFNQSKECGMPLSTFLHRAANYGQTEAEQPCP